MPEIDITVEFVIARDRNFWSLILLEISLELEIIGPGLLETYKRRLLELFTVNWSEKLLTPEHF